jgi:hypothetical protein
VALMRDYCSIAQVRRVSRVYGLRNAARRVIWSMVKRTLLHYRGL